jgi:hypothetical protein
MARNRRTRTVRGRLNRNCEFRFGTRRPAHARGTTVTSRFDGNARLLPILDGPERARLRPPDFTP